MRITIPVGPVTGRIVQIAAIFVAVALLFCECSPGTSYADDRMPAEQGQGALWKRLGGATRYDTMASVVQEGWDAQDGTEWAVVASGTDFPDALCASALAGALNAPVMLSDPHGLSPQAREELQRLNVSRACLMGGTQALGKAVEDELAGMGIAVERIEGKDRVQTSVEALRALAELKGEGVTTVVVATGVTFADALGVGPLAYAQGVPVVLTNQQGRLSDEAVEAMASIPSISTALVVGGTKAVSAYVATQLGNSMDVVRVAGEDRYQTSARIAELLTKGDEDMVPGMELHTWEHPLVATGKDFPDALAGAALAGRLRGVLLLADTPTDPTMVLMGKEAAGVHAAGKSYVLGGPDAVGSTVMDALEKIETANE